VAEVELPTLDAVSAKQSTTRDFQAEFDLGHEKAPP